MLMFENYTYQTMYRIHGDYNLQECKPSIWIYKVYYTVNISMQSDEA